MFFCRVEPVGEPARQPAAQAVGPLVAARPGGHPGRRALEHGHVRGLVGHRRDDASPRSRPSRSPPRACRHSRDLPARTAGGSTRPPKSSRPGQLRVVRVVVVVVARGEVEEARGQLAPARRVLDGDVPQRLVGAPVGGERPWCRSGCAGRSRARRRRGARYSRIASPSAIALSWIHGSKRKPSECMSLSERTPGIAEQVPGAAEVRRAARASRRCVPGHSIFRCAAIEMPEMPAPTISTSNGGSAFVRPCIA